MHPRPKNEEELNRRAADGIIRASRFVRRFAKTNKPVDIATVRSIHKEIWKDAWSDIAGEYGEVELKIKGSKLLLPHHSEVPRLMKVAEDELAERIQKMGNDCKGIISSFDEVNDEVIKCIEKVVSLAAWIHHTITYIHPFHEGNGRTARLTANLILERYGLVGISVKIEKENKDTYHAALAQIDNVQDYEPLKNLIYEGLNDRYNGVAIKYYPVSKRKK